MDARPDPPTAAADPSTSLFSRAPLPMAVLTGPDYTVHEVNPACSHLLGAPREALLGRPIAAAVPESAAACHALLDRVAHTGIPETLEEQAGSGAPDTYWSYTVWPVPGPGERAGDLLLQITDVTAAARLRRRVTAVNEELLLAVVRQHALTEAAEALHEPLRRRAAELQAAVADRETLLREVHHRVKNNLQMLCDAIYLQLKAMDNPDEHTDLQATYTRIFAVARLYEHLHQGSPGGQVALDDYLSRALGGLDDLHDARIAIRYEPSEGVRLDVDRAIHVGLILTELVFNALKHAFPPGTAGEITVRLRRLGAQAELQARDTGVGVPNGLDLAGSRSLGLRTVALLARGLGATVRVENAGGACFTITFPLAGS